MTKKIFLLITILVIFAVSLISADEIPENSHYLDRCVKFVNLNEFPDVVLIGYYTGPMVDTYETYQITNEECLEKGYKFNSLNVYWTTKEIFDTLDLKNLKLESQTVATGGMDNQGNLLYNEVYYPSNLTLLLEDIEPYGGYIDEDDPLIKETIEYSIGKSSEGKLIAYKSKQTSEYNDGQLNKIETFDINNQEPISEPKGFWSSICCFFIKIFGGSC